MLQLQRIGEETVYLVGVKIMIENLHLLVSEQRVLAGSEFYLTSTQKQKGASTVHTYKQKKQANKINYKA